MFAFLNDLAVEGHTIGSVYATTTSGEGKVVSNTILKIHLMALS